MEQNREEETEEIEKKKHYIRGHLIYDNRAIINQ